VTYKQKVLFIGWDAADWKVIHPLMDAGKMPHLQRLVERGAMGRAATLHPPLSPMLWTSIATGKRPFKHGIHGFSEPTPDGRGVRPITNLSRTAKAVWNILNQNGLRSTVIGWWPSHPAEPINGVVVSDHYHKANRDLERGWPLLRNAVHPPELHDTLAELRLHPQEIVGPMLTPFLPRLDKVDRENDRRPSMLAKTLAECVSIHSAATWLIENRPWDFFAVYYDAIDHFCHGFMKYHPPRQPWIGEADFELYSNVVSTAYVLHDQMLGTLLAKAGEATNVILMSDHGFHPDHLRPRSIPDFPAGPAIEHSPYGIFAMAGPGIRKDAPLFGISILDLAPTVLALYGLPAGQDMDGRVVAGAFEEPPEAGTIPSWEDVPGDDGRHPRHTRLDPVAAAEAMEQLVALGYIEKPGENIEEYVESRVRELRFNLIEACQDGNRHSEALEISRDLCRRQPDDQRYALKRFMSCQALSLVAEMREIVDDMDGRRRKMFEDAVQRMSSFRDLVIERYEAKKTAAGETPDPEECEREIAYELNPRAEPEEPREFLLKPDERKDLGKALAERRYQPAITDFLQAQTLTAERRWLEALEVLQRLELAPGASALLLQSADLLHRLGRLEEAEQTYRRALGVNPDNVHAHLGICRLALRRHDYDGAAKSASDCVGRLYFFPMAHFLAGVACIGMGDFERARVSLQTALSQNPHFPQAHLRLARLFKFRLNDPETANEHFRWHREMRQHRPSPAASETQLDLPKEQETAPKLAPPLPPLGEDVFVVSGLPRSGTSMLMQMLHAGGMNILTDRVREADEDNPKGYFEFEAAKRLLRDQGWLADARGKALKVVAPLVSSLPAGCNYRVLLIERDYGEILASQAKMIVRRGESIEDSPDRRERLRREYARLIAQTKTILRSRSDVRLLVLCHEQILRDPEAAALAIDRFAGGGLCAERMAPAVDRSLHRNRAALTPGPISDLP
jgi:predicted AlkP superfamily phosphohydrolase/phosphomutase/tetratricopeptide (TPR) repeat protein